MRSSSFLLVRLICWTDIWTQKYSIKCTFFIQQLNSHSALFVLPLSLSKTACYLALIFRVPRCQDCDSFLHQPVGSLVESFFQVPTWAHTLTQTSRNPFLKQQMNRLVDQPAPVRWGAPGPLPSGGVGGGCFSDWGERDWLWRRRREGGSEAGWRWGTPAAATAWSRRCRGLPRGSRCTRNKGT